MPDSFCAAIDLDGPRTRRSVLGDPFEGELVRRVGWHLYGDLEGFAAVGVINVEPIEERDVVVVACEVNPRMGGRPGGGELLVGSRDAQARGKNG